MITGHEYETQPLTENELQYAEFIGRIFTSDIHYKTNKVSASELCDFLKRRFKIKAFPEARLRKCINHLRRNEIAPIASDNRGYWQAQSEQEVDDCIRSLEDRIAGIQVAIDGLRQMKKMFAKQPQPKPKDGRLF